MYSWQISKEFMLAIHFEILIYIELYGTATFCILYSQAATSIIIVCSQMTGPYTVERFHPGRSDFMLSQSV